MNKQENQKYGEKILIGKNIWHYQITVTSSQALVRRIISHVPTNTPNVFTKCKINKDSTINKSQTI